MPGPALVLPTDCDNLVAVVADASSDSDAPSLADDNASSEADESTWRNELSQRLNQYRARRKMRPPRYPSLSLPFDTRQLDAADLRGNSAAEVDDSMSAYATAANLALALDSTPLEVEANFSEAQEALSPVSAPPSKTAKIIEFPRFAWGPPPPPPDELAEPVGTRPRILEAPEIVPPPPALGGITIEPAERHESEKRLGIDVPLHHASLVRRVVAGGVDALIIALASALFGYIFWRITAIRPPLMQIVGLTAGGTALFWAVYQYLLVVYTASTPGLCAAGLELVRFDGSSTKRGLRRWRVLGSYLSAASLGMGYVWAFLDEDVLCWHDRITHTYLAPAKARGKAMDRKT